MSFELAASGSKLRSLLQLLATCARIGESFFLEPSLSGLTLRSINESKSAHFVTEVPSSFFEVCRVDPADQSVLNVELLSKAVSCSVLRYNPTLSRLTISFNPTLMKDCVVFTLFCMNGVTKTFPLLLGEQTVSEKANVAAVDSQCTFRAAGEPRLWGSLYAPFSHSIRNITMIPSEHRLTILNSESDAVLSSGSTAANAMGSAVSADVKSFSQYVWPKSSAFGDGPIIQSQTNASPCGKIIELRPLKWFVTLADALLLTIRISTGGPHVPVHVEALRRHTESGSAQVVSFMSLLIAAVDVVKPPPRGQTPSAARSSTMIADASSKSMHQFATRDTISVAPSSSALRSMVELPSPSVRGGTSSGTVIQASDAAPQDGRRSASMYSIVQPSFADEDTSPGVTARCSKRSREDSEVAGSVARPDERAASCVSGSEVHPSSRDWVPSTSSLTHPASSNSPSTAESDLVKKNPQLYADFPLDLDALVSDDEDEDEDVEHIIASLFRDRPSNAATGFENGASSASVAVTSTGAAAPPSNTSATSMMDFASVLMMGSSSLS